MLDPFSRTGPISRRLSRRRDYPAGQLSRTGKLVVVAKSLPQWRTAEPRTRALARHGYKDRSCQAFGSTELADSVTSARMGIDRWNALLTLAPLRPCSEASAPMRPRQMTGTNIAQLSCTG